MPPQNIEAEQTTLASLLIDGSKITEVQAILTPDDFYREAHQKIFTAILELDSKSVNVDLVTLTDELRKKNQIDSIGGASYLAAILDITPTAENVEHHARIVKQKAILREIIKRGTELVVMAYEDGKDTDELLAEFQVVAQELIEKSATGKKMKRMKVSDFQKLAGLRETPYKYLNNAIGGFLPKELICVGGNKGIGKTSFVSGLLTYTAMKEKMPAIYCGSATWEQRFKLQLLSNQSGVPFDVLIKGRACAKNIVPAQKALDEAEIYYLIEPKEFNVITISAELKRLKREIGDLGIVIIENFQELRFPGKFRDNLEEQKRVATFLTGLTDELDAPVIISCQIGKETDKRENRRPMLSDLKDAGAIGEKATKVFLLYRRAFYNLETSVAGSEKQQRPEIGEVIIAKGGPPVIVPHYFDGATYRWWDKDD